MGDSKSERVTTAFDSAFAMLPRASTVDYLAKRIGKRYFQGLIPETMVSGLSVYESMIRQRLSESKIELDPQTIDSPSLTDLVEVCALLDPTLANLRNEELNAGQLITKRADMIDMAVIDDHLSWENSIIRSNALAEWLTPNTDRSLALLQRIGLVKKNDLGEGNVPMYQLSETPQLVPA